MNPHETAPPRTERNLPWGGLALVGLLLTVGLSYLGWMRLHPEPHEGPAKNVAAEARAFLSERGVRPLSESLMQILTQTAGSPTPTQPHPLLGKTAPDFELADPNGRRHTLGSFLKRGPVVLVFYYGYFCDHCVSQLFALDQDLGYVHEMGAEVVALSPDPPAKTRQRFRQFGAFHFPVLADEKNAVAECYGVFRPARDGQ
jgi:peroxiredoxin